jgi:hypothetical protein
MNEWREGRKEGREGGREEINLLLKYTVVKLQTTKDKETAIKVINKIKQKQIKCKEISARLWLISE